MPPAGHKQVGRLDVAMDDPLAVRSIECIGDLDTEREHHLQLRCARDDKILERGAFQEFHGDEAASLVLANLVDGADVGMVQSRGGTRLSAEALQGKCVAGQLIGKKLQGDKAAQFLVLRLVDDSHAAAAKSFDDLVAGNPGSNHENYREPVGACGVRPWYGEAEGRSTTVCRVARSQILLLTRQSPVHFDGQEYQT